MGKTIIRSLANFQPFNINIDWTGALQSQAFVRKKPPAECDVMSSVQKGDVRSRSSKQVCVTSSPAKHFKTYLSRPWRHEHDKNSS